MRRAVSALACTASIAALAVGAVVMSAASSASADYATLGAPKLIVQEPAVPITVVLGAAFFAPQGIFDLRAVQEHPVVRARRDYALMAALPMIDNPGAPTAFAMPHMEMQRWQLSRKVALTFPLLITGRNLVTAEIDGVRFAVQPTAGLYPRGGVFTFSGAF
jgi:hypothetical protein